jgi:hypothetical protein
MREILVLRSLFFTVISTCLVFDFCVNPCCAQPATDYSFSVGEARSRGTFIAEVEMNPRSMKWRKWEVTIEQAWIEKCKDGGLYLCFRIASGKEVFDYSSKDRAILVMDDQNGSVKLHHGRDWIQAVQHIDSKVSNVRFSLIESWTDNRPKNIRFDVKKKN